MNNSLILKIKNYCSLIALPHSVFALPFALSAFVLADRQNSLEGEPTQELLLKLVWVVLAILFARNAALAFNRIVDRKIDAANPRTKNREIPSGVISKKSAILFTLANSCGFFLSSHILGMHCLVLSPFVLAILLGYSLFKRFTPSVHLFLGIALALAPGGAWWVLRPQVELTPLIIMATVIFWVAGFDIIYSCQDKDFDEEANLHSIPAKFGVKAALRLALLFHSLSVIGFISIGFSAALGPIYYIGTAVIGLLFLMQHRLISPTDLSKVNKAFFTMNGLISLAYFGIVMLSQSSWFNFTRL